MIFCHFDSQVTVSRFKSVSVFVLENKIFLLFFCSVSTLLCTGLTKENTHSLVTSMSQNWKKWCNKLLNITSCTVRLQAAYKSWVHIPTLPLLSRKCSSEAELDYYYWWHHAAVADWTVLPGSNIMFKYLWMSALMHLVCMINYALLCVCVCVCVCTWCDGVYRQSNPFLTFVTMNK